VVTLSRSIIVPFLQFCPRRDLRQKAYEAWGLRGANGGATDNRGLAAETLRLREERAKLLGYDSFAAAQRAMTGLKPRCFKPNPRAHTVYEQLYAIYRRLHDAFGVRQSSGPLHPVMKELIAIRDRARK
jgi:hypothetical protein